MIRALYSILAFAVLLAGLLPALAQAQARYDGFAYGGPVQHYPYVSTVPPWAAPAPLNRRRHAAKRRIAHTRKTQRDEPMVIETARASDQTPRAAARNRAKGKGRVIHAEAEVTIFGPDRMIIRLYRKKSRGSERSVRAD